MQIHHLWKNTQWDAGQSSAESYWGLQLFGDCIKCKSCKTTDVTLAYNVITNI